MLYTEGIGEVYRLIKILQENIISNQFVQRGKSKLNKKVSIHQEQQRILIQCTTNTKYIDVRN